MRIAEVPIPTYYGDEICYVDGLSYAADVTKDVVAYRLQKAGFGDGSRIALNEEYQLKPSEDSSHGRISDPASARRPAEILDLGCSSGLLAERLREMGHEVIGVDVAALDGVTERTDAFYEADLNEGIPAEVGTGLRRRARRRRPRAPRQPRSFPEAMGDVISPEGTAIICVPNVAHWYPRLRSTLGMFDYDQRDPRLHASSLLHPAEHPQADRAPRVTPYGASNRWGCPSTPSRSKERRAAGCGLSTTSCWRCGPPCSDISSSSRRYQPETAPFRVGSAGTQVGLRAC